MGPRFVVMRGNLLLILRRTACELTFVSSDKAKLNSPIQAILICGEDPVESSATVCVWGEPTIVKNHSSIAPMKPRQPVVSRVSIEDALGGSVVVLGDVKQSVGRRKDGCWPN